MKDNNIFNLFAALLASTVAPDDLVSDESNAKENKTSSMVEDIRRQLMKDNYDYVTEETTTLIIRSETDQYYSYVAEHKDVERTSLLSEKNNDIHTKAAGHKGKSNANDADVVNFATSGPADEQREPELYDDQSKYLTATERGRQIATSGDQKLVYDYAESQVNAKNEVTSPAKRRAGDDEVHYGSGDLATPNGRAKYSVLKVRNASRRSESQRRLVKEEKEDAVSIVNLGAGPVPEFRLPRSRRQYMLDEAGSDLSYAIDAFKSSRDSAVDLER